MLTGCSVSMRARCEPNSRAEIADESEAGLTTGRLQSNDSCEGRWPRVGLSASEIASQLELIYQAPLELKTAYKICILLQCAFHRRNLISSVAEMLQLRAPPADNAVLTGILGVRT
jgi:hypothetical protein